MGEPALFELRRRTFDTPHFRGIEFIEAEAKTILNKVNGNYLPFNWTINPYRGCSHACSYCLEPSTPVLMADGRTRPIRDLVVGDRIYGTTFDGKYYRYVTTDVRAHWWTTKEAFRIKLRDGTELIASGDHRFLTNRGWKHVIGAEQGPLQRPHLTLNNKLRGTGTFAIAPAHDRDYRLGYLCGMIRGDGHVGSFHYERVGRSHGDVHSFRLALIDFEPLLRSRDFLNDFSVHTSEFVFYKAVGEHNELRAIRTSKKADVDAVRGLIAWPTVRTDAWSKGFLAGIFDAEGSYSGSILRICNCDQEIIDEISSALDRFGFNHVIELRPKTTGRQLKVVRVTGGLHEHVRFFLTVDPAITRKRTFEGKAIKHGTTNLQIESIEPLGVEIPMCDITTGTGDFIANGVVSHNCFARVTHTYMDMNAGRDFESKIVVKVNAPDLLRKELRGKRWQGESVALGTSTDPYQRAEGRYRLMPRIIETFTEFRNPFSILTKGTLILRDLPLLQGAAAATDISTAFSIPTLDEEVWRKSEPGTPHPRKRLEAVAKLNEAGIPCGVMIAPILPGISDAPDQIREVVEAAIDAGATHVSPIWLHLRPVVKDVYMSWLEENYPDLVPRYMAMYARSAYGLKADREALSSLVRGIANKRGGPRDRPRAKRPPSHAAHEIARLKSEQLSLI